MCSFLNKMIVLFPFAGDGHHRRRSGLMPRLLSVRELTGGSYHGQ
jgi:hypothetical protein